MDEEAATDAAASLVFAAALLRLRGVVLLRKTSRFLERAPEDELDLAVEAPELVGGPSLEGRVELRIHPDEECLSLGQGAPLAQV
jgi:hypothetical protein